MKVIAYYALHYGMEWLAWSMRSVRGYVDEICVFYSSKPSHGQSTELENPEPKSYLKIVADMYDAAWFDGEYEHEGIHRDHAVQVCVERGADIVLVIDADEIWPIQLISGEIDFWRNIPIDLLHEYPRNSRVPMIHFWRSVNWGMPNDQAFPVRVINPRGLDTTRYISSDDGKVLHMGYAQSPKIIEYKQSVHGHKNEWRENWFEEKFMKWQPGDGDVHPTNVDYWTPEPMDKAQFHALIHDHPYYFLGLIE